MRKGKKITMALMALLSTGMLFSAVACGGNRRFGFFELGRYEFFDGQFVGKFAKLLFYRRGTVG